MPHTTRICLVRHGETAWNVHRRLQGHTDIPLNARGLAQARAAALALRREQFQHVYSSDLLRAAETARIIATPHALAVTLAPQLRERHFGGVQGLTWEEAEQRFPEDYGPLRARVPDAVPPEGGESLTVFSARIVGYLNELGQRHPGETLLVVCHGGCLDVAYRAATGKPLAAARDFPLGNATLNWIHIGAQGWALERWDDDAHLVETSEEISI